MMSDISHLPNHTSNVRSVFVGIAFWLAYLTAVIFAAVALCIRAHSDEEMPLAGRLRAIY